MGPHAIGGHGLRGLDTVFVSSVWLGLIALAMILQRQPARRCILARLGLGGSLLLIPLVWSRATPPIYLERLIQVALPPPGPAAAPPVAAGDAAVPEGRRVVAWILGLLYSGGLFVQLAGLGLGWWGTGWLARTSTAPTRATSEFYAGLAGRGPRPRLRVSTRVVGPVLVGGLRSTILIPRALDRVAAREALRLGLLHELAHASRRDPLFGLIAEVARAFWFFWPPAWWIRAQMRLDQEFLADRLAARGFRDEATYASALLEQAGPVAVSLPADAAKRAVRPSVWLGGSALFQRFLMLLSCPFPVEATAPRSYLTGSVLLTVLALPTLASLSLATPPVAGRPPAPQDDCRTFRMPRLAFVANEHPSPYPLPVELAESFRMTGQIWADRPESIAGVRFSGWPLPAPPAESGDGVYRFTLERRGDSLRFWWDDVEIRVDAPPPSPGWLTVCPAAGEPLEIRRMEVTW